VLVGLGFGAAFFFVGVSLFSGVGCAFGCAAVVGLFFFVFVLLCWLGFGVVFF